MFRAEDIPVGSKNAISRAELAKKWGCSDRVARKRIAILRCERDNNSRYVIVSHSRNGVHGYYRSDDPAAIEHFIRETEKRARSTFRMIQQARRVQKKLAREAAYGEVMA